MRCDECQTMIDAYFDGELDDESVLQLTRHLNECAPCGKFLQQLKAEQEVYGGYKPQVEVRPELWAQVQSRIVETRPGLSTGRFKRLQTWIISTFAIPRVSGWATAALVLIAIGLTVTVMNYIRSKDLQVVYPSGEQASKNVLPSQPPVADELQNVATTVAKPKAKDVKTVVDRAATATTGKTPLQLPKLNQKSNTPDRLVREAEQKYLAAIAMLKQTVERKRTRLDTPTLARLEQSLAAIDRTIAETRKVVRQHPNDPVAVQYMLSAYSRKVDVLREVIGY